MQCHYYSYIKKFTFRTNQRQCKYNTQFQLALISKGPQKMSCFCTTIKVVNNFLSCVTIKAYFFLLFRHHKTCISIQDIERQRSALRIFCCQYFITNSTVILAYNACIMHRQFNVTVLQMCNVNFPMDYVILYLFELFNVI